MLNSPQQLHRKCKQKGLENMSVYVWVQIVD